MILPGRFQSYVLFQDYDSMEVQWPEDRSPGGLRNYFVVRSAKQVLPYCVIKPDVARKVSA